MQFKAWIVIFISVLVCINRVSAQPQAGFTMAGIPGTSTVAAGPGTINICIGTTLTLHFTASEAGGVLINTNAYTYNNGTPSSLPPQQFQFPDQQVTLNTPGPDTIWQVVTDQFGLTGTIYQAFLVSNTHPDSAFSYTPAAPDVPCGSTNFTFTARNQNNDPNLTYAWTFQASSTPSVSGNPAVIQFNKATGFTRGKYPATLVVTDEYGCSSAYRQYVLVSQVPDVTVTSPTSPVSVFNGQNVFTVCGPENDTTFKFLNSSGTYVNNRSYVVKWGDGTADSSYTNSTWSQGGAHDTISHLYNKGFDTLTVTATGFNGCSNTASYGVFVGSNAGGTIGNPGGTTYLCTGDSVGYRMTGFSGNARGTIYIIKINENPVFTDTLRQENLPKTEPYIYWHKFNQTSCSVASGINPGGQFTLSYSISNPCQPPTTGTVNSVYVSGKPSPQMAVSPSPNICNTTTLTLTDTTNWGEIYLTGAVTCSYTPGEQVWEIKRLSGSGTYSFVGNPGSPLPSWKNGDKKIQVNFTGAGIFEVTLHVMLTIKEAPNAPACAMKDTFVKQVICVRNPPVAKFLLNKIPGCAPDTLTAAQVPDPNTACLGDSLIWAVNPIQSGNCNTPTNGVRIDTGRSAQRAKIIFPKPGRYQVLLTVYTKNGGGCSDTYADTITVNGPPLVSGWVGKLPGICAGDSILPTANVDSCFSPGPVIYQWSFNGGSPSASNVLAPPYITYKSFSAPAADTVQFSAGNGCGTVKQTALLTVFPKPILNAVPGKTICSGSSVNTLLSSPDTGVVYHWAGKVLTGNITGVSAAGSGKTITDILNSTSTSVVEYDVVGTFSNGPCFSDTIKILDTVLPSLTANAGPGQFLCKGTDSTQLHAVQPATGFGTWVQAGSPSAIIRNATDPATEVAGLVPNNVYSFVWVIANTGSTCVISTDTVRITLDTIVNLIDQPLSICPGDTAFIKGHIPAGPDSLSYTYQWLQSADNITYSPVTAVAANNRDITIPAPPAGYYSRVVYFHSCLDTSNAVSVITRPAPIPSFILSDTAGCSPLSVLLTNTTSPAPRSQFIYQWLVDNNILSQAADTVRNTFNGTTGGYGDTVYRVTLKATNGCVTVADTGVITVRGLPKALFTPDNSFGCSPMTVLFINNNVAPSVNYHWSFGDGGADTIVNDKTVSHTFHVSSHVNFNVVMQAKNSCGTTADSAVISVNPSTIGLHFSAVSNFACAGDTVLFVNNSTGANIFNWNFGDRQSNSNTLTTAPGTVQVTHTYNIPGNDTVTLCAANGCTQDTCATVFVFVKQTPRASFTASPDSVCTGSIVSTVNLTQPADSTVSYKWTFGDGSGVFTDKAPVHKYLLSGTDTISLTASTLYDQGFSCSSSASHPVAIYGPTGTFTYKDTACTLTGLTLQVISSNTSTYLFDFGDNSPAVASATPVVTHIFEHPGTYLPKVTLTTGECSTLVTGAIPVRVDSVQAGFTTSTVQVCDSTTVLLGDSSYAYFGIQTWEWTVNGNTYTGSTATQKFNQTASYPVSLKVTGKSGCSSMVQSQLNIYVHQSPSGKIVVSADTCARDSVYFSADVFSNDQLQYLWNFGDGQTANGQNVATAFTAPGPYAVSLISLSSFGCADTLNRLVTIQNKPHITITPLDSIWLCSGNTLELTASGDSVVTWNWAPVNGLSCFNCASTLTSPTISTLYTVTGTNNGGCSGNDSVWVRVVQPFKISATPPVTSVCLPDATQQIQFFAYGAYNYIWSPATWLNDSAIFNPQVNIPPGALATGTQLVYHVTGYDQYHCFADTASVMLNAGLAPVIDYGAGNSGVAGRTVILRPLTETNGPFKPFSWSVLSGNGTVTCLNGNCDSVQLTINSDITFKVTVENVYGCSTTDTIHYLANCNPDGNQVYVPTGFSPDGDGINDVFMVQGEGIVVDYFKVFNRWGQLVFDGGSNFPPNLPARGWNGTVNGRPVDEDVYVYVAKVTCTAANISYFKKGNVTLIRVKK